MIATTPTLLELSDAMGKAAVRDRLAASWKCRPGKAMSRPLALVGLGAALVMLAAAPLAGAERLALEARETAGFRRTGFPCAVRLALPAPVARETPFRLLDEAGTAVAAQFRPEEGAAATDVWWLDFGASLEPWASRRYTIEYGEGVEPGSEPDGGHDLRETDDAFVIENAPYITWTVPRDLTGLLRSVAFPPNEHLQPQSPGLFLVDRQGTRHGLGGAGTTARVVRHGPRCVVLRFSGSLADGPLSGVRWEADLTFPSPVSWVEVACTAEDPAARIAGFGFELHLALDPPNAEAPTLVDFGAWTYIYASLYAGEAAELGAGPGGAAGPRGADRRGPRADLRPIATSEPPKEGAGAPAAEHKAEGWVQAMDRRRCLALAVADFGAAAEDALLATAEGQVQYERRYPPASRRPEAAKQWRAWLHFVHYPPQHSAATSPRMMQTPPEVRVLGPDG
jgi:hypothetical protein